MEDRVDSVHRLRDEFRIGDVADDQLDGARVHRSSEILTATSTEVVDDADFLGAVVDEQVGDVRANESRAAGDQYAPPFQGSHGAHDSRTAGTYAQMRTRFAAGRRVQRVSGAWWAVR